MRARRLATALIIGAALGAASVGLITSPSDTREELLQKALGDRLSPGDIAALNRAGRTFGATHPYAETADLHGMRASAEPEASALAATSRFIDERVAGARELAAGGNRTAALLLLGQAMHPAMDAADPSYRTSEGKPRVWHIYGFFPGGPMGVVGHERALAVPSQKSEPLKASLRQLYARVFPGKP